MSKDIAILKMGSTFEPLRKRCGDFEDWILERVPGKLQANTEVINAAEFALGKCTSKAIIITGSHGMVSEPNEHELKCFCTLKKILEASTAPFVFGICYGHQLLAQLLGGKAAFRGEGGEIGLKPIQFFSDDDPILGCYARSEVPFFCIHYQSAAKLPPDALLLAKSSEEAHHAFRFGNFWGVQFHPEFPKEACLYYDEECVKVSAAERVARNEFIEERFVDNSCIADFLKAAGLDSE